MTIESSLESSTPRHLQEEGQLLRQEMGGEILSYEDQKALNVFSNQVQLEVMNRLKLFSEGMSEDAWNEVFFKWAASDNVRRYRHLFAEHYLDEHKKPRTKDEIVQRIVEGFQH